MKLGEALALRAVQAKKLAELRERIARSALVQEGDEPSEDVVDLVVEHDQLSDEHRQLVESIHRRNTDSDLLADLMQREHLRRVRGTLETTIRAAAPAKSHLWRLTKGEIRSVPTVDVAALQKELDRINEEIRQLDAQIQGKNWQIDV